MVFFGRKAVERMLRLRAMPFRLHVLSDTRARCGAIHVKPGDAAPPPLAEL
jgi:hypothetical protein